MFLLYKNGLPLLEAMSASLMTFVVTIVFFVVSAGAITFLRREHVDRRRDRTVSVSLRIHRISRLRHGVHGFYRQTRLAPRAAQVDVQLSVALPSRAFPAPGQPGQPHDHGTAEIHEINVYYIRNRLLSPCCSLLLTAVVFGFKCFVAYFIVRGLGVSAGAWEVVSIQILILLAVYFFPTPGGTGAAELGSAVLMAQILPMELLMVYVVLWRVVVMYVGVVLGSVVMLRALGQDTLVTPRPGYGTVEKKIAVSGK